MANFIEKRNWLIFGTDFHYGKHNTLEIILYINYQGYFTSNYQRINIHGGLSTQGNLQVFLTQQHIAFPFPDSSVHGQQYNLLLPQSSSCLNF